MESSWSRANPPAFFSSFPVPSPLLPATILLGTLHSTHRTRTLGWWRTLKHSGRHFSVGEILVFNILCLTSLLLCCPSVQSHQVSVLFPQSSVRSLHCVSLFHHEYLIVEVKHIQHYPFQTQYASVIGVKICLSHIICCQKNRFLGANSGFKWKVILLMNVIGVMKWWSPAIPL